MKATTICPKCNGSGRAEIGELLESTLKRIGNRRATADELLEEGVGRNAITNRLEALYDLGLVGKAREHRGAAWRYFRTTQPAPKTQDR